MSCECGPWETCTGKIYNENWEECVKCGHRQLKGLRDEHCERCGFPEKTLTDGLCAQCVNELTGQ